jgi:hypothetical protein
MRFGKRVKTEQRKLAAYQGIIETSVVRTNKRACRISDVISLQSSSRTSSHNSVLLGDTPPQQAMERPAKQLKTKPLDLTDNLTLRLAFPSGPFGTLHATACAHGLHPTTVRRSRYAIAETVLQVQDTALRQLVGVADMCTAAVICHDKWDETKQSVIQVNSRPIPVLPHIGQPETQRRWPQHRNITTL